MFKWGKKGGMPVLDRPSSFPKAAPAPARVVPPGMVDVRALMQELTIEELCATAEKYIAHLTNWDYQLAKPFASIVEAPLLLNTFAQILQRLQLQPEMTVIDFGAGTGWLSHCLSQLNCEAVLLDASASALRIAKELYERQPMIGERPEPKYLVFNGRDIEMPDKSVDRIICMDAFHHVPNPQHILGEMRRVLKDGGIIGFAEPGPQHSINPQSQYEMKNYRVVENDIIVREIWDMAKNVGFTDMKVAAFTLAPLLMSLDEFDDYLAGGKMATALTDMARWEMRNHRLFFLYNGESMMPDSRTGGDALNATIEVKMPQTTMKAGTSVPVQVKITNTGRCFWITKRKRVGEVRFGGHLCDSLGAVIDLDYFRESLPDGEVWPGRSVSFKTEMPAPAPGKYVMEFDLVAEQVAWFAMCGTKTVRVAIEVT